MFHSYLNIKSKFEKLWGHKSAHVSSHHFLSFFDLSTQFYSLLLCLKRNWFTRLQLQLSNPFIFATWWCKVYWKSRSNFLRSKTSGYNDVRIKKLEFYSINQFLHRSPLTTIPKEHYYQGCNARKVNCGRAYSAYILKPVLFGRNL